MEPKKDCYSNTKREKYDVGTVTVSDYKTKFFVKWEIQSYFFRCQYFDTSWDSPVFKMWDDVWKFRLKPNIQSRVFLKLHPLCLTPAPSVVYSYGILKGDYFVYMSTEPQTITESQRCFEGWSLMERTELLDQKRIIAPNGTVTFFMNIYLANDDEYSTSNSDVPGKGPSIEDKIIYMKKESALDIRYDGTSQPNDVRILTQNLADLFLKQQLCDVTIKVGNREIPSHRYLLAARSPIFACMFEHDTKEKETGIIDIDDCDPEAFYDFLVYLYTAKVNIISSKNAVALYSIADKYDLPHLAWWCEQFILTNLSVANFCDVLAMSVKHNKSLIVKAAEEFFAKNAEEILDTVNWQNFMSENCSIANELFIKYNKKLNSYD